MQRVALLPLLLILAACGSTPTRPAPSPVAVRPAPAAATASRAPTRVSAPAANPCAPTREHHDSDYTAGGLYLPGVSDSGPAQAIDVSQVREPVPRAEPRSRYGNRSPYSVLGKSYRVLDRADGYRERGLASWYGTKFNGRATSSGELYDICQFTAAHKTLPLPSFVRVTNLDNGRSLVVRVNDRGPFHAGRIMDLSYAAAVRLGVDRTGTARVELQAIGADGRAAPPLLQVETAPAARVVSSARGAWQAGDGASGSIVQVGSFGERGNAHRLLERLQRAGLDAVAMDHVQIGDQDLWRVRIGPVLQDAIEPLLERLRALDLPNARVFSE